MITKRTNLLTVIVLVLSLLIVSASLAEAQSKPRYGGILRLIEQGCHPGSFGWPAAAFSDSAIVNSQFCLETLLYSDIKGNLKPRLATSWEANPDDDSIIFHLRKGVKFHDGTDFNAQAVKFNFDAAISAKKRPEWSSVEVLDDHTVRVKLNAYNNSSLFSFYGGIAAIVSPSAYEKHGEDWMKENMVGTGPFMQVAFDREVALKTKRNENYWEKGLPYLDGVEMLYIGDPMTQYMAMEAGEADALGAEASRAVADLISKGFNSECENLGISTLLPDSANPGSPLADKRVRMAIDHAIDKDGIVKNMTVGIGYQKGGCQACQPVSSSWNPDFKGRTYDPEKAKKLLADAGYNMENKRLKFTLIADISPNAKDVVASIQSQLAEVGIDVKLEFPAVGKWIEYLNGTWENAVFHYNFFYSPNLNLLFTDRLAPDRFVSILKSDAYLKAYETSVNCPKVSHEKIQKVVQQIHDDATFITLYYGARCWILSKKVQGAHFYKQGLMFDYDVKDVWMSK